ncbi:MAG: cation:proton antiporter, partial [Oscillospiraceae bacterium]
METYLIFKDLAIVVFAAEVFGLLARKLKAPQVVGQIIAGLLIGPSVLGLVNLSDNNSAIAYLAEIGVMLIMFSAGLETNLKELVKTGPVAL